MVCHSSEYLRTMVTLIKVRLNMQKSVRSVVPEKTVKADGGKGTTLGISQDIAHLTYA